MSILDDFNEWLERFEFIVGYTFCDDFVNGIGRYVDRNGEAIMDSKASMSNPFESMLKDYCYIVANRIGSGLPLSAWNGQVVKVYDAIEKSDEWCYIGGHTYIRCR